MSDRTISELLEFSKQQMAVCIEQHAVIMKLCDAVDKLVDLVEAICKAKST